MEHQKTKGSEGRGQERLRDFAMLTVKHSVAHRPTNWIMCHVKQREERAKDIGTARRVAFHSHRGYHGTNVWSSSRKVEQ